MGELLKVGSDINAHDQLGWSALLRAARNGHVQAVEFLLAAGIDKNAINSDGNTALMLAAGSDKREVADTLLAAEVDVDVRNAANHTALMYATSAEIVAALVKSGVDVDATDQDGNSALHRVAEDGEEAVVSSSVAGWGKCRRKEQGRRDRA